MTKLLTKQTQNEFEENSNRIPYGEETHTAGRYWPVNDPPHFCVDCGTPRGTLHELGCPNEQCPECKGRLVNCWHDIDA